MGFLNSILFIILSITILYQSLLHLPIVVANDVLMPGEKLNSLDTTLILLSSNGIFTLGFFTLNPSTTNLTYLGIWVTNEQEDMILWVANRNIPIIGDGILTFDDSGTLRVTNRSGATLFNVSNDKVGSSNNNTRAMLQDSGNFLIYDIVTNRTVWQSFDHPTDSLLPGMKLGYNLTTRQNWTLTSWADDGSPALGAFTMRLEQYQNSSQLLIHRRGELYWASGPWDKSTGNFLFLPSMTGSPNSQYEYNMNLISDASGMYFTFQTTLFVSSILQLSPDGKFVDSAQNPDRFTPDFCYGYQRDDGCAVSALPYCRVLPSAIDNYYWDSSSYISGPNKTDDNSSISLGDCMERCWNDCTCAACSTYNNGTGCIYWTEHNSFGEDEESRQVYVLYSSIYQKMADFIERFADANVEEVEGGAQPDQSQGSERT